MRLYFTNILADLTKALLAKASLEASGSLYVQVQKWRSFWTCSTQEHWKHFKAMDSFGSSSFCATSLISNTLQYRVLPPCPGRKSRGLFSNQYSLFSSIFLQPMWLMWGKQSTPELIHVARRWSQAKALKPKPQDTCHIQELWAKTSLEWMPRRKLS